MLRLDRPLIGTPPNIWNAVMGEGIKKAMREKRVFPWDGSVELTVVKYGYVDPPHPETVIAPTIITNITDDEGYYHDISQFIRSGGTNPHPGGHSPLASAMRYTADLMYNDGTFNPEDRQVFLIITAGVPDSVWVPGGYEGFVVDDISELKLNVSDATEYINTTHGFDETQDEINVLAVNNPGVDIDFLNNSIPLPKPSYLAPPITTPGWVFNVTGGWKDFDKAIEIAFKTILNSIRLEVSLEDSTTIDPNDGNNYFVIYIQPTFIN